MLEFECSCHMDTDPSTDGAQYYLGKFKIQKMTEEEDILKNTFQIYICHQSGNKPISRTLGEHQQTNILKLET